MNHGFVILAFIILTPPCNNIMSIFQIHFMYAPHVCGLLGVLNILYSQCCGMATQRLNCSYRHRWNGVLHCGHLLLATVKVMRHCKWYICWQVPKIHVSFGSNGEQKIRHSSPFCMKGWGVGHKSSLFFLIRQWQIPNRAQDVSPNLYLHFPPSGKLLENVSYILGHDVKPCDQNLPSSWYSSGLGSK
jgi:hypothetical protein